MCVCKGVWVWGSVCAAVFSTLSVRVRFGESGGGR